MNNFLSSKKVLWIFVVLGFVAIAAAVFAPRGKESLPADNTKTAEQPKLTEVPNNSLPDKFPTNLPIEPTPSKVTENFNSTAEDGTYQATRAYVSARTPADNYKNFNTFFRTEGWTVLTASDGAQTKSITAQKDNTTIQVLAYNTIDAAKASMVKINVTISPGE